MSIQESDAAAHWIWSDTSPFEGGQVARFRLTFEAKHRAVWKGFADTFYTIFINGKSLGIGPTIGIAMLPRLSEWDFTPHLHVGVNVLAIEVWYEAPGAPDVDPLSAGLIGWLYADDQTFPTDARWRAKSVGKFTLATPERRGFGARRIVIADLRGESDDFVQINFDDSNWIAPTLRPHPDPKRPIFRESSIPNLTCTPRMPTSLIDAGMANGSDIEIRAAEHIAQRMIAQKLSSTLLRTHDMSVLVAETPRLRVYGLPPSGPPSFPIPVAVESSADGYLVFDMGLQTTGNVWVDVESTSELHIDIGYADHLQHGRVNPMLQNHFFADRIILGSGRQRVHLPMDRGFRYVQLTFTSAAILHAFHVAEHVYPADEVVRFHSSDATLNAVWQLAVDTAHQCSIWSHVDNARRERQGWGGPDLYAQMHGFFHLRGDLRLTRKMLEDFLDCADVDGFIPNWAPGSFRATKWISGHDLWFPQIAWDYVLYSNDRALGERLLRASEAVMAYYAKRQIGGLYAKAHPEAIRWAEWNMNSAQEVSTWENLLAIQSWRAVSRLRKYMDAGSADAADVEARRLYEAVNTQLWHPAHQALAQGTRDDGTLVDHAGQVDNAYALLNDLIVPARRAAAYRFCAGPSETWPTARSGWQGNGQGERARFDARKPVVAGTPFASSLCARAIQQMSPSEAIQYIRYNFGAMLDEGEGGLWEMWPVHQREDVSSTCFSQGYGIHIAATLIQTIVGITFSEPGGAVLQWRPVACGLAWLEARVETIFGSVSVRMEGEEFGYEVPSGVSLLIETSQTPHRIVGPAKRSCRRND